MKMKSMKLIIAVIAMIIAISFVSVVVNAVGVDDSLDVGQFKGKTDNSGASGSVQNIIGALITIIQIVGSGVAIIMLIVLAIKYISAAPGDKAEIKKHAVVYVVGAVILFAATGILQIVKQFASNIDAES